MGVSYRVAQDLVAKDVVHLPPRCNHPGPGIDVDVPLKHEPARAQSDVLGLSPLSPIASG